MSSPAPSDTPAPSDATPLPSERPISRSVLIVSYCLAINLTVLFLVTGLRLDKADFHAPFSYEYDALLILPMVKATIERGSHWRNERLGAPGIQELHDFPVVDHLHFAIIWILGRFFADPVVVFNLFHILTYPLTTLTAMFVLRQFGLSLPAAGCGAILYTFQPYHYLRGELHYFLSAYYVVPLSLMVVLWICQGRLPLFRKDPEGKYRFSPLTWDSLATLAIAVATGTAGAYYAFFSCAMLCAGGVYGWVAVRNWRAAASAAVVTGLVIVVGFLNHVPTMLYHAENGRHTLPTLRFSEESELYGMKIAHLVLPVTGHNFRPFAALRSEYNSPIIRPLQNENEWDSFGLVGAIGYVGLLVALFLPVKRPWPIGALAALNAFGTLLGTIGGVGAIFSLLVTAQVRCMNRISIFLAFLSLFAVCWTVDGYFRTRTGRMRRFRIPAFVVLTLFGFWDQTNDQWFPDFRELANPTPAGVSTGVPTARENVGYPTVLDARKKAADRFYQDRAFFQKVQELVPDGMIFTFPYVQYPESPPVEETGSRGRTDSYEMARGYLHTDRLRWSFGGLKGREVDTWIRSVVIEPVPRMLERIAIAGFDGLLIDRRGLNPGRYHRILSEIDTVLGHGSARVEYPEGGLIFFDLQAYRRDLLQNYGKSRLEEMTRQELETLVVLWLDGFVSYEPVGYEWKSHWCRPHGEMVIVNRTGREIRARARMTFRPGNRDPIQLRIRGKDLWTDTVDVSSDRHGTPYERILTIPPGRHTVFFDSFVPDSSFPSDSRNLVLSVSDFKLTELPPASPGTR